MSPSRRHFLAGALASAALPSAGWADVGRPTYLSAAKDKNGAYALYGLRSDGALAFRVPLPDRGHAAAAHATAPEAVAFARRPGRFAVVIDCLTGGVLHRLDAPNGTHFYGHGVFSKDGDLLFTTENDIATGQGQIGVWSRSAGYVRIDSFRSQGIGPHEIIRLPATQILAVANGGIKTHPDSGREALNLETMAPNLALIGEDGRPIEKAVVPTDIHLNSLRHIAAASDGTVVCAFQWQGDIFDSPPLLARFQQGQGLTFLDMPDDVLRQMKGYAGSVAVLEDVSEYAVTSPRGGVLAELRFDGDFARSSHQTDICGVAASNGTAMATDGRGRVYQIGSDAPKVIAQHDLAFDNHLVAIASV